MSIKKRNRSRKIRRLKSQLNYYRSSLVEMQKASEEYETEWVKDSSEIIRILKKQSYQDPNPENEENLEGENKKFSILDAANAPETHAGNGSNNSDEDVKTADKDPMPDWAKNLYRNIAKRTHPDICQDDLLNNMFREASAAVEKNDYNSLIDIALDANIEIEIDSAELVQKLESRITNLRKNIYELENSAHWVWGESYGIPEIRFKIISVFLKKVGVESDSEESKLAVRKFIAGLDQES